MIRCTVCREEFEQGEEREECPGCGTVAAPMAVEDDIEVTLNKHEIRILVEWAAAYAVLIEGEGCTGPLKVVDGIFSSLKKQTPETFLTQEERAIVNVTAKQGPVGDLN